MFGRQLLRGFGKAWGRGLHGPGGGGRAADGGAPGGWGGGAFRPHLSRGVAAAAGAGPLITLLARNPWTGRLIAGVVSGGAVGTAAAVHWREDGEEEPPFESGSIPWVQALAETPGMREMLVPGQMLRKHPVGQLLTEDDHLFETMRRSEQVREFRCFYDPRERKFYSVVLLGKDVCGYPSTVHGGLTAAIVDESFGGLYTALLTSGNLGATLPGLTARLELDYKRKIPAGTVLLVTAELETVEPRKVWMRASVSSGTGPGSTTFATGRALFVAPNIGRQISQALAKWKDGLGRQLAPTPAS